MNSRVLHQPSALIKGVLAIIVTCLFFVSCKKDDIKVTLAATISGFSPSSGPPGTVVVISGSNFSTLVANDVVTFNGTAGAVSAATVGQITATVPSGATTGKIVVAVSGAGSATSTSNFTVQ